MSGKMIVHKVKYRGKAEKCSKEERKISDIRTIR
jgi:hypothetical protein